MIKSEWTYIRLNYHFLVILYWCHVSAAANGFQKFAISLLKMKFLPIFNTTAPLCKSNSGDPRNFNILSHHSYNHFPFYLWGGVIGQFSLVFALPLVYRFTNWTAALHQKMILKRMNYMYNMRKLTLDNKFVTTRGCFMNLLRT